MVISKTRAKRSSSVFSRVTRPSRVTRLACFALSRITLASFLRAKRQLCSQVFSHQEDGERTWERAVVIGYSQICGNLRSCRELLKGKITNKILSG